MAADLLTTIRAEIDARLSELRPFITEYEGLLSAADALALRAGGSEGRRPASARKRTRSRAPARKRAGAPSRPSREAAGRPATAGRGQRAPRGAAAAAVLAALEHGSHTVRELVTVTALSDANIRVNVRRMLSAGTVVKVSREGKAAYALANSVEG